MYVPTPLSYLKSTKYVVSSPGFKVTWSVEDELRFRYSFPFVSTRVIVVFPVLSFNEHLKVASSEIVNLYESLPENFEKSVDIFSEFNESSPIMFLEFFGVFAHEVSMRPSVITIVPIIKNFTFIL